MKKSAEASWSGGLKNGTGKLSTESGALRDIPFGFRSRFEEGPGSNPEELIGAALAGCFSMALSLGLEQAGHAPQNIHTTAQVHLDKQDDGFAITAIDLTCRAQAPGMGAEDFARVAEQTKQSCPVSKVLNARITLDARLEG